MRDWLRLTTKSLASVGLVLAVVAACSVAPAVSGGGEAPAGSARPAGATNDPAAADLAPAGPTEEARVVRIVDGDTIIIDRGHGDERLRYIGIDTPESVKPDTPVQFMAEEAAAVNERLVGGREIVLERDVSEVDPFGRLLRYVWFRDGERWLFVNLELVRRGFAHAVTYPPDVHWLDVLRRAEREARSAGVGLWAAPTPAP